MATVTSALIWAAISVVMMITAVRRTDGHTRSFVFLCLLALTFLIVNLVNGLATGQWAGIEFWMFVLLAEYAATIRSLPPRGTSKRTARVTAARSER